MWLLLRTVLSCNTKATSGFYWLISSGSQVHQRPKERLETWRTTGFSPASGFRRSEVITRQSLHILRSSSQSRWDGAAPCWTSSPRSSGTSSGIGICLQCCQRLCAAALQWTCLSSYGTVWHNPVRHKQDHREQLMRGNLIKPFRLNALCGWTSVWTAFVSFILCCVDRK